MKAEFTEFNTNSNWVSGNIDKYQFQAKLFDESSEYGINEGRVSKLSIWDEEARQEKGSFLKACIVNYDRGWDIEPKSEHQQYYDSVMFLLENSSKRFENEA